MEPADLRFSLRCPCREILSCRGNLSVSSAIRAVSSLAFNNHSGNMPVGEVVFDTLSILET
jgi:hypothetical protein